MKNSAPRVAAAAFACVIAFAAPALAQGPTDSASPGAAEPAPVADASRIGMSPRVLLGTVVPDLAPATIRRIGDEAFVLDRDTFAFWAQVGPGADDFALLGWRRGALETLGVDKRARLGGAARGKLALRASATVWRRGSVVLAGPDQLLIGERMSGEGFADGVDFAGADRTVRVWDADGLRKVAGPGDTVAFAGKTWTLATAGLLDGNGSGTFLLLLATSAPAKARGLALWNRDGLQPVLVEGERVPGEPAAVLRDSRWQWPVAFDGARLGEDGGVFLRAYLEQTGKKRQALWYFTAGGARPLLTEGDDYPGTAGGRVKTMEVLAGQSAERFVAWVTSGPAHDVFIRSDGQWLNLTGEFFLGQSSLRRLRYLSPTSPHFVFLLGFELRNSFPTHTFVSRYKGLAWFDGLRSVGLLSGEALSPIDLLPVPAGGPHAGVIVVGTPPGREAEEGRLLALYLDAADPARGLQPVPALSTPEGLHVPLHRVLGWLPPDEALVLVAADEGTVAVPPGLYLVRRGAAPPAASASPGLRTPRP